MPDDWGTDRDALIGSFAAAAQVDPAATATLGTSVIPRPERAGTGQVAGYWILGPGESAGHTYLWVDPEIIDRFVDLADATKSMSMDEFAETVIRAGGSELGHGVMRTLAGPAAAVRSLAPGYTMVSLDATRPADLALIQGYAELSDPDDVEEAALDEVDETETDIWIVVPDQAGAGAVGPGDIAAYASSAPWDWDPRLGDIGVLVTPAHRGSGLGSAAVAATVDSMRRGGRVPMYRHSVTNQGSEGVAAAVGFQIAIDLAIWRLGEPA